MDHWRTVVLTCLLVSSASASVTSIEDRAGYDPGDHGPRNANEDLDDNPTGFGAASPGLGSNAGGGGYGGNRGNAGDNEWTPMEGPSGSDRVYVDKKGAKTLIAGSPTSPVAEAINFNPPRPIQSPPLREPQREHYGPSFHQQYQFQPQAPQRPPVYGVETNLIHTHQPTHPIPVKTITNPIHFPVPRPYKVFVDKKVPFEVKVPVKVPVPRPYQVVVPRPVSVPVDKPYDVVVERKVPYEVRVPVQVPVQVPYPVEVPQPYPVSIPVPRPIIVKHPVPVVIKFIKSDDRKGWFW